MRISIPGLAVVLSFIGMSMAPAADPLKANTGRVSLPKPTVAEAQERVRKAEASRDEAALIEALNGEADALLRVQQFDAAEKLRLQVLRMQEKRSGRDSLPVADALLNLGWFYGNMARYERAQDALDRCLDLRQRLLGPEAVPVAEVYNALGVLEENRSNYTLAEAFYHQAIEIQEKMPEAQKTVVATTWNNLATLYWITGDYAQAQQFFAQALAVREKTLGPNSIEVAATLRTLALLDSSLGDYDEAENYFQRALKIRQARLGPDHPLTITTLSDLAELYVREGDDARAEPLLVKTVEARLKTYRPDHPDVARVLSQLGQLYDRRRLYAKAEPLLVQALEIRRKAFGTDHPEYAASLAYLARHAHAQGRLAEALPLYEQALKIDEAALGEKHPDTLAIATDLAYLKAETGQRDPAARLARDVADAQQDVLNSVFTFAPERQRMNFEKTIEPCDLPAALGDASLLARVVLRTKGVVLDSLLEDEALTRAERDPEVRELIEKQRLLAARLLQVQEEALNPQGTASALADRQQLEKEERDLEASLARKGIGSGKTRRALTTDVGEVCDVLPKNTALIEYIAYNRYTGRLGSEPSYGAVVLSRGVPPKWVPLGPAAGIKAQVQTYQKYMRKRVRDTTVAEVLQSLDRALCQPVVAALPPGVHQLIISPDGDLNFVSFATLLSGKDRFFSEDFDLQYVSSGRDLLQRHNSPPARKRLVAFANPDYAHLPGTNPPPPTHGRIFNAIRDAFFNPLPGTEREAAFLLAEARKEGLSAAIYRGREASKANLATLDSPYVLHLATHGLYLSGDDVPSLAASPVRTDGARLSVEEPMLRSLLALAGASVTLRDWKRGIFPPSENDGLLTAQEVAGLNLDRTWLVVLSACDTGSGEARAGEGVLGLRRGFAEAGAQNLLMTLWTVDDAETADLMEAFYREALRTGDAPGALARVQRESLKAIQKKSGLSEAVRKAGPFILSY